MNRIIILLAILINISFATSAQDHSAQQIKTMLSQQEYYWNEGNIEKFMEPYWKSDSLMFIGKSGVTYGWDKALANYQRSYPDTAAMGKLKFEIIEMKRLSVLYYHVVGKWHLSRTAGDLSGHFTLLIKRIGKEWVIVSDHSS
ncbi:MAG: nuclear transport factor 2 family protein [Chitinophagaceae bacterium]|nr:MAG: nuclear transport factor 2 family protein [Chitinophagaceae bacterium]